MQNNPQVHPRLTLALLAALCLCTLPLAAQNSNAPGDPDATTTRLNGIVVNSLDGKPVARVLVTSSDSRMATMTDSEGRFSFELRSTGPHTAPHVFSSWPPDAVLPVTTIALQFNVRKPGYISGNPTVRIPSTQPSTPEPVFQLKIVPAAVLTGHIDPESGDLPPNASVQLIPKVVFNGDVNWGFLNAQVNSRGEFRFANLPPRDYKLLAPAYVPHGNPNDPPPDSIPGFRAAYYPNADSFDSADIIHLNPGETATANLTYRPATFYRVTIPVTGLPETRSFESSLLPDVPGLQFGRDAQNQTASGYLLSGDYDLLLRSQEITTPTNQFPVTSVASVHLQVTGKALRTEPIALHPAFQVPVEVRFEFTNTKPPVHDPLRPETFVWAGLQPIDRVGQRIFAQNLEGQVTIRNLAEGSFRVEVTSAIGGYVASVTSGTTDLLREPLRVLPGVVPRPIEVTLRDDAATLNARLAPTPNQQPQATNDQPAYILCLPLDRPEAQAINFTVQRDDFPMPNLAPGRYLILASHQQLFQGMEAKQGIEYRNPDVLRDLIPKGATITLSPNQKADIEIPLLPDEEGN